MFAFRQLSKSGIALSEYELSRTALNTAVYASSKVPSGTVMELGADALPDDLGISTVVSAAMNPIFAARGSELLGAALAVCGCTSAVAAACTDATAPSAAAAATALMRPVPPVAGLVDAPMHARPPLYVFPPRATFLRRIPLSARVIVVGASETALVALAEIAADCDYELTAVTLLAPGGSRAAPALHAPALAAATREPNIAVLEAALISIDRYAAQANGITASALHSGRSCMNRCRAADWQIERKGHPHRALRRAQGPSQCAA